MDFAWHILRVSIGSELGVQSLCAPAETFLPVRHDRFFIRRYRKVVFRASPVIPGYIFVHTDSPRSIFDKRTYTPEAMRLRRSIRGFLRNGDRSYALLSPKDFALLTALDERVSAFNADEPIQVGKSVRVPAGPFEGLEGIIQKLSSKSAYLDVGHGSSQVRVKLNQIVPADQGQLAA